MSGTLPSKAQIKAEAKALHATLKSANPEAKLGQAYEIISHQYGFQSWNHFSATLSETESAK